MEAECYSPGFIRTELKAGKFVSTCSLLISFSGRENKASVTIKMLLFLWYHIYSTNDIHVVLGLILLSGLVL